MSSDLAKTVELESIGIHEVIVDAIMAACSGLDSGYPPALGMDTPVYGTNGFLDSLGLVASVLEIERQLEERYGIVLSIMDDRAFSTAHSPFRSVRALESFVRDRIKEALP